MKLPTSQVSSVVEAMAFAAEVIHRRHPNTDYTLSICAESQSEAGP